MVVYIIDAGLSGGWGGRERRQERTCVHNEILKFDQRNSAQNLLQPFL